MRVCTSLVESAFVRVRATWETNRDDVNAVVGGERDKGHSSAESLTVDKLQCFCFRRLSLATLKCSACQVHLCGHCAMSIERVIQQIKIQNVLSTNRTCMRVFERSLMEDIFASLLL